MVKAHHSLADGISWLHMNLQSDPDGYDLSKVINFPTIPWYTRWMIRLMIPISIVRLLIMIVTQPPTKNKMRDPRNEKFTGKKHCFYSDQIPFDSVKKASRNLKCTINDVMTCAVSKAVGDYLSKRGDESKEINICIPANIRWGMYKKYEDVKLENKFAPIALTIPLVKDFSDGAIK